MVRMGAIQPQYYNAGIWSWNNKTTDKQTSCLKYISDMRDSQNMYLNVKYVTVGKNTHHHYNICIERTPLHLGGYRYWFICPYTKKRAVKLYAHPNADKYSSRQALGLLYTSQSENGEDRAYRKKRKILSKFNQDYSFIAKPKGMHNKTYERLLKQHARQKYICDCYFMQLGKRMGLIKETPPQLYIP